MKNKIVPKVVLVPFGYPDYPKDIVDRFVRQSEKMIRDLDVDLLVTDVVRERKNIPKVRSKIQQKDFDLIIALLVSWVEAPSFIATLQDFMDYPLLLWTHTTWEEGKERLTLGAMPAAGVIRETLEEMKVKFEFIWGMPDSSLKEKIASFARVTSTIHRLKKARIGLFGYFSMGMYTGGFDHVKLRRLLGPEVIHLGQYYIIKRSENIPQNEVKPLMDKAKKQWNFSGKIDEEDLLRTIQVYLALKYLARENALDALSVKCQYELSREWGFAPCVSLSLLADELTCSCEGDLLLTVSQLILHYLTGKVVSYGDVHDIKDNSILVAACGFAPLSLVQGKPTIGKHTALYKGLLNMSAYSEGKVTLARLANLEEHYKMHIATGRASSPPSFHEVGCPPYAGMEIILDGSAKEFIYNLMSQHYAICYGDVKDELISLCQLLDIKPVLI